MYNLQYDSNKYRISHEKLKNFVIKICHIFHLYQLYKIFNSDIFKILDKILESLNGSEEV